MCTIQSMPGDAQAFNQCGEFFALYCKGCCIEKNAANLMKTTKKQKGEGERKEQSVFELLFKSYALLVQFLQRHARHGGRDSERGRGRGGEQSQTQAHQLEQQHSIRLTSVREILLHNRR